MRMLIRNQTEAIVQNEPPSIDIKVQTINNISDNENVDIMMCRIQKTIVNISSSRCDDDINAVAIYMSHETYNRILSSMIRVELVNCGDVSKLLALPVLYDDKLPVYGFYVAVTCLHDISPCYKQIGENK